MQFLIEGARNHEPVLYVTLSETKDELADVAKSHNLSLDGITIYDLALPANDVRIPNTRCSIRQRSSWEKRRRRYSTKWNGFTRPSCIRFSIGNALLAGDPLRYRRQILALKHFFVGRACTVLLLDDNTSLESDRQLESLAHGVVLLEQQFPKYGRPRRQLRVLKLRGVNFEGGCHDFGIETGGIAVYPSWSQRIIRRTLNQKSFPAASPNSML